MCGIFGIKFMDHGRIADMELVVNSTDTMDHRGPDDAGYWIKGSVGLGHRRLSIIDLSPLGHQPMFNEDGNIVLVYNGEIYNYHELYKELSSQGHIFKSRTDTEVIIHAYEEWGHDCIHKFNGMFAFGLWDERTQSFWLVRDRLGIKPLYYYLDDNVFIFSSEIKPILKTGFVKSMMNEKAIDSFFSIGYVPGPETMFKDIKKIMPGHFLCLRNGRMNQSEYWDFAEVEQVNLPMRQYEQRLENLFRDSVSMRLRSDVPLGVFLSGGLDSSAVVAIMSEILSDPINTFTVGYTGKQIFSEEPFANLVAAKFKTRHRVFKLEPDDFFSSIVKLVEFAEEPILEPAAIALYHISKLARQFVTVLLSGEGSDEIFAGYYLYELMGKVNRIQKYVPMSILGLLKTVSPHLKRVKINKYSDWLGLPLEGRYHGTSSYLTNTIKREFYSNYFYNSKGDYLQDTFSGYFEKVKSQPDDLSKMLYVDTKTWLADDLLLKADKMTMAASVELRVPFLDYRIVELAASFPSNIKLDSGNAKIVLKSIMKNRLPDSIIDRYKMGFPVPINNWFGNELLASIQGIIIKSDIMHWIKKEYIDDIIMNHSKGIEDNSKLIMSLLVFVFWKDHYKT
ncbi:MAG: asparagine synthase (glutamine-hydrolyzing) [Deltaproteobacteria bacterium]|nr:MAG: asparagine synthase (glutamine-hydrolyzing) [Deltaproteobacteria bacterium]